MQASLRILILRFWPLPPVENRRGNIPPIKWLHSNFQVREDSDYLCYLLFKIIVLTGIGLLILMAGDIALKAGIFFDPLEFEQNKLILSAQYSRVMGLASFVLSILFYLRIRLSISSIRSEHIPICLRKISFVKATRRKVRLAIILLIATCIFCIFMTHVICQQFILHFKMQDSTAFVLISQFLAPLFLAAGASIFVSMSLSLEKSTRYFSEFISDLMSNGASEL